MDGWKTQPIQYSFMPFVERKCRSVLSVLLCNVCSSKFDVATILCYPACMSLKISFVQLITVISSL